MVKDKHDKFIHTFLLYFVGMFRTQHPPNELFTDEPCEDEEEYFEEWEEPPRNMDKRDISRKQLDELLGKNMNDAVKQSINVDREDEEIHGDVLLEHADGTATTTEDLLNFDTITENVNLGMRDGTAEVQIKVRCERIVPMIRDDMYRKSSIIVTRNITIDLAATEERKLLYKNILRGINKPMLNDKAENNWGMTSKPVGDNKNLSMRETFKVYKQLMGIADTESPSHKHGDLIMERRMEQEEADIEDDNFLRAEGYPFTKKKQDDDTISFMSVATENSDILF